MGSLALSSMTKLKPFRHLGELDRHQLPNFRIGSRLLIVPERIGVIRFQLTPPERRSKTCSAPSGMPKPGRGFFVTYFEMASGRFRPDTPLPRAVDDLRRGPSGGADRCADRGWCYVDIQGKDQLLLGVMPGNSGRDR